MSHFSGVWEEAEKIYYLLTDSKCPALFLDNKHAYDTAKWLASKGVTISKLPNRRRRYPMPETTWFSPDTPPKVGDGYNFLSADVLLHTDDGDFVGFYDTDYDLWYRCSRWGTPKKLPKGTVKGWRPLKEERK